MRSGRFKAMRCEDWRTCPGSPRPGCRHGLVPVLDRELPCLADHERRAPLRTVFDHLEQVPGDLDGRRVQQEVVQHEERDPDELAEQLRVASSSSGRGSSCRQSRSSCVLVVRLSHVQIHESARRHGVAQEDIEHALAHAVAWAELGDDPPRYLLAGPDRASNLLELVVLVLGGDELVIHAMGLRRSTAQELFGDE